MTVMKVSKPTYDVRTATNDQLSFNSELATHSIYSIVTVSKGTTGASYTINHNLSYAPKVWVFIQGSDVDGTYLRRVPRTTLTGDSIDYYVDNDNVVIEFESPSTAYTLKVVVFTRSANI